MANDKVRRELSADAEAMVQAAQEFGVNPRPGKSNSLWLRHKGVEFRIAKPGGQAQLTLVGSKPAALGLRSESWQPSSQSKNANRYHYIGRTASHEITAAFGHASGASVSRGVEAAQMLNAEAATERVPRSNTDNVRD